MAKPEFKRFTGTGGTFYEISESGVLVYQTETGHPNARRIYEASYDLEQAEALYAGILETVSNFRNYNSAQPEQDAAVSQEEIQTILNNTSQTGDSQDAAGQGDGVETSPALTGDTQGGTINIEPGEYKPDEIASVIANEAAIGGDVTIAGGEQPALPAPAPAEEDTAAGGV